MDKNIGIKKIRALENRNAVIQVRNASVGSKIKWESKKANKWILKSEYKFPKEVAPLDTCFADFIKLGKKLYEVNTIQKMTYQNNYTTDLRVNFLVVDFKNEYNDKTKDIIYKYCNGKAIMENDEFLNSNIVFLVDNDSGKLLPIETNTLADMSIFSYLVISALNNYFEEKNQNNISFSTFTTVDDNKIDDFLDCIFLHMEMYEPSSYSPPLTEHTSVENKDGEVKAYRIFDSIFALYWFLLKLQIIAITNNTTLIDLCGCGEVIIGKDDFCPICKLAHKAKNKREQRSKAKEEKEKSN